jgi:hypothetical protein
MADIDRLLKATRPLEAALRRKGADGRGLHGLVSSVETELPADLVKQIRWLATLRNKAVHEEGFRIQNIREVEQAASRALRRLGYGGIGSTLAVQLAPHNARRIWLLGIAIAAALGYAKTPFSVSPMLCAGASAGLAAWTLHPARQPRTLAFALITLVLAGALRALS